MAAARRAVALVGKGTREVVCVRFIQLAENSVNKLRIFVYQPGVSDSGDQRRGHDTIGVMILLQNTDGGGTVSLGGTSAIIRRAVGSQPSV